MLSHVELQTNSKGAAQEDSWQKIAIQRSEILFDGKKSVLLNFRRLNQDEGQTSEIVKEITQGISSARIPALDDATKTVEKLLGDDETLNESKRVISISDKANLKLAFKFATHQLKSLGILR